MSAGVERPAAELAPFCGAHPDGTLEFCRACAVARNRWAKSVVDRHRAKGKTAPSCAAHPDDVYEGCVGCDSVRLWAKAVVARSPRIEPAPASVDPDQRTRDIVREELAAAEAARLAVLRRGVQPVGDEAHRIPEGTELADRQVSGRGVVEGVGPVVSRVEHGLNFVAQLTHDASSRCGVSAVAPADDVEPTVEDATDAGDLSRPGVGGTSGRCACAGGEPKPSPRIRILRLPGKSALGVSSTPFILVVDGIDGGDTPEEVAQTREAWRTLKDATGAAAVIVVVDQYMQIGEVAS